MNFSNAINWWLRGLGYLCPASVRKLLNAAPELITIEFNDQEIFFKRHSADSNEILEQRQFNSNDDIERARTISWLQERVEDNALVTLVLPDDVFLRKKMVFPKAAGANLRRVLSFEMNRKTPFNPEQVYFDYLLNSSSEKTGKLHLELFLVSRDRVDPFLVALTSWGIKLDAIRPLIHQDNDQLNLIAPEERPSKTKSDKPMLVLATTACLLFMAVLYAPITIQKKELSLLESAVAESRKAAIHLQTLNQDKETLLDQSHFLKNKRLNEMSSIKLINEVTQIVPDDTWLTRFVIKSGELQLQGESSNASSLIQTLQSSNYFTDVQFRSPITQNKISHKDKFHLSAKFTRTEL